MSLAATFPRPDPHPSSGHHPPHPGEGIAAAPSLWLHGRNYDIVWYAVLPLALYVLFTSASAAFGGNGPLLAYVASATFTGIPHNMITWLMIMPERSRGYYMPGALLLPLVLTAVVMVPTALFFGTAAFGWALSIGIVLAYYHIVRQHMGLLSVCDLRYVQATGDRQIHAETVDLRRLLATVAAAAFAWKTVGPPMLMGIRAVQYEFTFYPLPLAVPAALTGLAAFFAVRYAGHLFRRNRADGRFPTAHVMIAGCAMASLVAAAAVPNGQFFLTLALVGSYHNLQYFAFCYTHHHLRAQADPGPADPFTLLARSRRWRAWFAVPLVLGSSIVAIAHTLPTWLDNFILTWLMTSHYFVDGNIWRRKYYPLMGRFFGRRVGEEPDLAVP